MVASVAGMLPDGGLIRARPFRAPHHSASMAALIGGGQKARPGEVSLAHLGILFLDELPEFQRQVLDSLRQPLETGVVTVARAGLPEGQRVHQARAGPAGRPAGRSRGGGRCRPQPAAARRRIRGHCRARCRRAGAADRALRRAGRADECRGGRRPARFGRDARRVRAHVARTGGDRDAPDGAQLSSRPADRADDCRPGGGGAGPPCPCRRSTELSATAAPRLADPGEAAVRQRPVEAARCAGVAGRARGLGDHPQCVLIAIDANLADLEDMT